ncbi:MAG: membrane dipeptidase [candidate division WOR-3 bacterium]|nr:membrane dipeptidase [candidate division WOR-3 bacterium]
MKIPVFDLHCDTPLYIKKKRFNHIKPRDLNPVNFYGAIFAHFVYPREKEPFDAGIKLLLKTINYLKDKPAINILYDLKKSNSRKTNIILGVEGGHIFDKNLTQFETLYEFGVRVFTITWNNSNKLAHSALEDDRKGLTKKGRDFIKFIKNYDIIIDLSHASTRTVLDVCEISDNLVIASHSCIRKLNPFLRNIDDKAINAIVDRGGVIGINLSQKHLGSYGVIDHILYLYENFGCESAGLGSDFDGITDPVMNCPQAYEKIANILLHKSYSFKTIEKIFFRNFLNALKRDVQGVTSV